MAPIFQRNILIAYNLLYTVQKKKKEREREMNKHDLLKITVKVFKLRSK
jgi:hypothetical protein